MYSSIFQCFFIRKVKSRQKICIFSFQWPWTCTNGLGLKSFTSSGHRKSLYKVGTSNVSQLKKDIDRTKLCSFPSSDLELTKWPWVKVMRHNHIISNLLCEVRISKLQISLHKKDLDWHDFRDWRSDRQMDKIIPVYPPPKKKLWLLGVE